MSEPQNLPALLMRNAATRGDQPAIREKHYGIWETLNWREYAELVSRIAHGLAARGFGKGDKLAVIGDNRPRLYAAQLAAQCLGGAAVPVYQDAIASELAIVLSDAGVKAIAAEDQEQVDKIQSLREQLPSLECVAYDDDRGLTDYSDEVLVSMDALIDQGKTHAAGNAGFLEQSIASISADDTAFLVYTSGTTGKPKGVMLSHGNIVSTAEIFVAAEDVRESDDFLAYLPMAWVGDATYSTATSLLVGCASNCPEAPETLQRDLRELGPTGMVAAPRAWENMLSVIQVKAADNSAFKRVIYSTFVNAAISAQKRREEGKIANPITSLLRLLGEILVYGPIRDQLGLRRARWCYTGGAPLGPDTFRYFRAIGVNLKQVYGSTEVSGLVSLQRDGGANPDNVGPPCKDIEVKLGENSEVLVRSKGVFKGYYNNDEAYKEAVDSDGFFHTGDAGIIESDGNLTIIDRAKDVGKLSDGTAFAPQFVENKLKFSPYISEAISFGDEKPFVTAMVAIDLSTVGNWAEKRGLPYTNYQDLSQKDEVRQLIQTEVQRINRTLPEVSQVKRFLLLAKDFDADDAEITRTRKLRRGFISERYEPVINAFYNNDDSVDLQTEVTFEDGRKSVMDTQLTIQNSN